MASRHAKIVKEHEKRQMKVLKERQEEYGLAFEEQIRQYQQYGSAYGRLLDFIKKKFFIVFFLHIV